MSKKDDEDDDVNIQEEINFNEDKTMITYTLTSDKPIDELEFIYCLRDFVRVFGEGFDYREVGELVPFEMFSQDCPDDGVYH